MTISSFFTRGAITLSCCILSIGGECQVHAFVVPSTPSRKNVVGTPFVAGGAVGSSSGTSITRLKATWSNGQAIKEYQDFLATGQQEINLESDGPSIIVTPPNLQTSTILPMVNALNALGGRNDLLVTAESHPTLPPTLGNRDSYPIYVALPPSELHDFLRNVPEGWYERREDFIFLSGGPLCGNVEPVLKRAGYARDAMTQVLVSGFTTPEAPMVPQDVSRVIGIANNGEDKLAGECMSCGKWCGAVKERLEGNGIRCKTGFYREWRRSMWERAAFDAIFNLVGIVRDDPTTIKDVAKYYEPEISDMLWEATSKLRGMLAVTLSYGFEERLFGFATQLENAHDRQCVVEEDMYEFMFCPPLNQCPMIVEYLNFAKDEKGLLGGVDLPKPRGDAPPSLMRQGNLRADGVI